MSLHEFDGRYWNPAEVAYFEGSDEEEQDTRPLGERCPRCNATKDQDNAVCDDCGDVVGCAYCGGTKEIPDPSHPITSGYEGFLFAGPQMMVACTECAP